MSRLYQQFEDRCEFNFPVSVAAVGLKFVGSPYFSSDTLLDRDCAHHGHNTVEIDTIVELKDVRISFDGGSYVIPRLLVNKIIGTMLPTGVNDGSDVVAEDVKPDVVVG